MIDKAALFCTEMLNHPDIIAQISPDKVSWDVAPEAMVKPFINFDVYDDGIVTKNAITKSHAKVRVYAKSLSQAGVISSVVRRVIKENNKGVKDRGAKSGYTDDTFKEAAVEISLELPKLGLI